MVISFGSWNKYSEFDWEGDQKRAYDWKVSLGYLCKLTGQRPSSLFEWTEEHEWIERLVFDLDISNIYWEEYYRNKSNNI